MQDKAANRSAFITGAGGGIGRAIALALGGRGYALALNDVDEGRLGASAYAARQAGAARVETYCADISDSKAVRDAVEDFTSRAGALGKVFANAGIGFAGVPFGRMTPADWSWLLAVNVQGAAHLISAALPDMLAAGRPAQIEITSSLAGLHAMPGWHVAAYAASKSAVSMMAQGVRDEIGGAPVSVSVVYPGLIATDIGANFKRLREQRSGADDVATPEGLDVSAGMPPAEAARIILDGMDQGIEHIFTHPDHALGLLDARYQAMAAGIEASWRLTAAASTVATPAAAS
ncbi:Short-chain dehydrogenase/reductase [Sphingomonas paucimobilis]|uniref:SDR family NAD(P)-dependent oxidoreductase n=1 Tax=Sphingobium sp. DC-2 TaxID=1303256 RepID=UPI00044E36CA|nr:SDR family NAD(P)-dependent oxidoreductase [Sphingobium sp. DC-2]EZP71997.1 Short-chain dehydrogenase/reductase [Sphingomonas paucimobilis]